HALRSDASPAVDGLSERWMQAPDWFRAVALDGGTYTIVPSVDVFDQPEASRTYGVRDEARCLSVNHATAEELARIFVLAAGRSLDEAAALAACIVDWRDPDNTLRPGGAEDGYYRTLPDPYPCKNAPFESLDELLLVRGIDPALLAEVRPLLTAVGDGRININTAGPAVLQSCGLQGETVDTIVKVRRGSDGLAGTADDLVLDAVDTVPDRLAAETGLSETDLAPLRALIAADRLAVGTACVRGVVEARAGSATWRAAFVLRRDGRVLAWRRLTDAP
ncbi:MAG: general secretion pathway protein GspK, partial [Planctomycetota bacterium]